jgi:hypothetical protein
MDRVLQRMSQLERKRLHPMGVIYEEDWESNDEDSDHGELCGGFRARGVVYSQVRPCRLPSSCSALPLVSPQNETKMVTPKNKTKKDRDIHNFYRDQGHTQFYFIGQGHAFCSNGLIVLSQYPDALDNTHHTVTS